jgi:nicotinate-nucleotide adenylyltransferase
MRIGVFGGTFDPPHVGHLILAAESADQLGLDRILWVLTPDPPHKRGWALSPIPTRVALVGAAICDNPLFELSRVDLDRRGPYYAVDTLRLLADQMPGAELVYLVGGDSLRDLPGWYHPAELLERAACLGVMRRPQDGVDLIALEQQLPGITARVKFITAPLLEISSRQIRQRASHGQPYRYYLPPTVYQLILSFGLYLQA